MKNNKILILLILFSQGICCASLAQPGTGTTKCNGGDRKQFNNQSIKRADTSPSSESNTISYRPIDPNEIIGLDGYNDPGSTDTLRWVSATQSLAYTIYFENDAELAMAAASKVTITVPLHDKLNYATFGVGSFGFGNHIFAVEGSPSSYQTRLDLRDSLGIYLDVVAGLDIVHNEAFWIFQSIDPATGLPPTAINMGFLPINDSLHSGEGFVSFTVKSKANECVTGDTVTATASIVFDVNEAIPTNTWLHTVDAFPPTSTLNISPNAAGDMLAATFAGEDDEGGCGIKQYKLYYSVNGSSYQLYDVYPVGDTAEIPVETGMEYAFFTLAEDNVGNCEPMKTQPEYTIGTNFVTLAVNAFPLEAGTVTGAGTYSVNDTAVLSATASEGYHFVNWMCQGVPVSSQTAYAVGVTQNQTFTAFFERSAYTLQTLAAAGSTITVTDLNGNEVPSGSTVLHADKLIVQTTHEQCYNIIGNLANDMVFTSGDTITVTGDMVISTQTLPLYNTGDTSAVACDSYDWYGTTYTLSGDYTHTLTNASGCDSVVILHLTVNYSSAGDTTAVVCDSFDWYGATFTSSGDYTYTLTNAAGCDSVVTLHLTVNYSNAGDTTAIACDSFDWYGTTYTQSGNYPYTLTNANGCDSVVTLHLTLHHSGTAEYAETACGSYAWNDMVYTQSGDYVQMFTNVEGCDSVVTLHLTIHHPVHTVTTIESCDSYTWQDTIYTLSGDYTYAHADANGCTQVDTLHLTIHHPEHTATTVESCDSYIWHGTTYTLSGDYTYAHTDANGCTQVDTLHLTIHHPVHTATTAESCDSYVWQGVTYTSSGDYTYAHTDANGCTQVDTLHLTIHHPVHTATTIESCDSYVWQGVIYTSSGDYTYAHTDANGCTQVDTLHLTIHQPVHTSAAAESCDSYTWHGTTYTSSGDYTYAHTDANGCTQVDTLHLTIHHPVHTSTAAESCDSYTWHGTTYTSSGDYTYAHTDANGCTQVDTLHLTIHHPVHTATTAESCDSYIWQGVTYTASGDYIYAHADANGCTQVDTLHLTIHNPVHAAITETACESFTWNGTTYTQSGDYTYSHLDANGCTQVDTLHLAIHHPVHTATAAESCDSYVWQGTTYTSSGDYTYAHTDANGCTQVDTLHLTIHHPEHTATAIESCDSYIWQGETYTESGSYVYSHTDANGCTQVDTLYLIILDAPTLQAISGETEICLNQFATYSYDISDPDYQYRWFKDNTLWAENVPAVTIHELNEGSVLLTMQVADEQSGCAADTSLLVQVVNRIAPDTTEIRRKENSNILFCQSITSNYGTVHYRWGYTNRFTLDEVVMPGDHNYCLYDFGIDTFSYRYWVETYLNSPVGEGCDNRSYYGQSYGTATVEYEGNAVEAYLMNNRIVLYASLVAPDDVSATLYDMNGKQLLMRMYGHTETVSDVIPVNIAPGVYLLKVHVGNQIYSFKLLKI